MIALEMFSIVIRIGRRTVAKGNPDVEALATKQSAELDRWSTVVKPNVVEIILRDEQSIPRGSNTQSQPRNQSGRKGKITEETVVATRDIIY